MKKDMKVIIAGGGTGGHLFPAIAVAEEITKRYPPSKITFVGTLKGLEARIIPLTMWELVTMDVPSFKGMGWTRKIRTILNMPSALLQSRRVIKMLKPDMVIGVGGYSAGPVTLVASLMMIPTAIMEQNAIAGFTNRILGKFVKKIFVTFDESKKFFPKKKVVVTGNPVRSKIRESFMHRPVKRSGLTILVFGGSQGAKTINENMIEALTHLSDIKDDIHIIHQVGRTVDTEKVLAIYKARGFSAEIYHFIEDMGKMYQLADVVVCRAGATSVAELTVAGKPAILIPYPFAADDHQEANARSLVAEGAVIMMRDSEMTGEKLAAALRSMLEDQHKLSSMGEAMKRCAKLNAAEDIVNECVKMI